MQLKDLVVIDDNGHKVKVNIKTKVVTDRHIKHNYCTEKHVDLFEDTRYTGILACSSTVKSILAEHAQLVTYHNFFGPMTYYFKNPPKRFVIAHKRAKNYAKNKKMQEIEVDAYRIINRSSYRNFKKHVYKYGKCTVSIFDYAYLIDNFVIRVKDKKVLERLCFCNDKGDTISIKDYIALTKMSGFTAGLHLGGIDLQGNGDTLGKYGIYIDKSDMFSIVFVEGTA